MRIGRLFFLFVLLLPMAGFAQVWEKLVAPGLIYRMELDLATPRMVHALRFTLKSGTVAATAELGQGKVYMDDVTKGRETISGMAKRTSALAAINADFFPFTGDPLGLMMRNGELVSLPFKGRAAFGWGSEALVGVADCEATLQVGEEVPFKVDGLNQECGKNEVSVNSAVAGNAVCRHENRMFAVIKIGDQKLTPNSKVQGEVDFILDGTTSVPIQPGNIVVAAQGTKVERIKALTPGQKVTFFVKGTGFDWSRVQEAVGGGPFLVQNWKTNVDWVGQGFAATFANKRHPRTAVGLTSDGDLWFVAVDGRQKISDGATLSEMAAIMLRLGCVSAINLDGGGSTTLSVLGVTVNRPSDGTERAVANGVVWNGPETIKEERSLAVRTPPKLFLGDELTLSVIADNAVEIPNSEVVWAAQGKGWIDQGGRVRTTDIGSVLIQAYCRGQLVQVEIPVEAKPRVIPAPSRSKGKVKKGGGR